MKIKKIYIVIFTMTTVFALTGCSRFSYCCPQASKLLSQTEAETISGLKMNITYDTQDQRGSACSYAGKNEDMLYSVSLSLHRFTPDGGPANELAHRQGAAKYGSVETINDVGESGFLSVIKNGINSTYLVYARKGEMAFQLHTRCVSPANECRERTLKIARIIAGRLG